MTPHPVPKISRHLLTLIARSRDLIERALIAYPAPVILWSGGKDSTVLLHLIHTIIGRNDIHCIQWREPRFRHRYAYSDRLIREWDLTVHDYAPAAVSLADGLDIDTGNIRFDYLKHYQIGATSSLILSLGTERPATDQPYLCGLHDCLQRPVGTYTFPWRLIFHGQKSADIDPIKGPVPLPQDLRILPDGQAMAYPLRGWTDADIWGYLTAMSIPIDTERYSRDPITGDWGHSPDKSQNADYYPICFNCVNRHTAPLPAWCPVKKCEVNNISHAVPYNDLVLPEQGFRAAWPATTQTEKNTEK